MYIAFYKGFKGKIDDIAISIWTLSKYSHVELIGKDFDFYTASPRQNGVRKKKIPLNDNNWDYFKLDVKISDKKLEHMLENLYQLTDKCKYDWLGIFFYEFLPLKQEDPKKFYCSEWVAYFIRFFTTIPLNKIYISPGRLYRELKKLKVLKKVNSKEMSNP